MKSKTGKVIIAGGGTGGHIFPAVAIANALKNVMPALEILFIGARGKMEMEKVPEAGYSIQGIDMAGFNRSQMLKNISLPFKLIKSYFQVKEIFKKFPPDVVIGVGGYSTFPVLRYAQKEDIPTYIHESNSFAGKSNILLGKKAVKVFVATDGMEKFFPQEKIQITGNPVRKKIVENTVGKEEARNYFNLHATKPTVLVVGGSLGAKSINDVIAFHLSDISTLDVQLIWQTGKNNSQTYISMAAFAKDNIYVSEFISEMEYAYAAADIVVARAGAMTVSELCVVKKPVIFVPYPYAAEDHQTVNAMNLVNKKAAEIVPDSEVRTKLFSAITDLLFNEEKKNTFIKNISVLATTNANEVIASEIIKDIFK